LCPMLLYKISKSHANFFGSLGSLFFLRIADLESKPVGFLPKLIN
jgi:hypothetical protein